MRKKNAMILSLDGKRWHSPESFKDTTRACVAVVMLVVFTLGVLIGVAKLPYTPKINPAFGSYTASGQN
jgi:hypothetical protein